MAQARILHAAKDVTGYHFLVHLDQDWTVAPHEAHELALPAGSPHPEFIRKWDFGHLTPGVHIQNGKDMTEAQYLISIEAMLKEQVELELQGIRFYKRAPKTHTLIDSLHGKEL
jgi:hypothetical protein